MKQKKHVQKVNMYRGSNVCLRLLSANEQRRPRCRTRGNEENERDPGAERSCFMEVFTAPETCRCVTTSVSKPVSINPHSFYCGSTIKR